MNLALGKLSTGYAEMTDYASHCSFSHVLSHLSLPPMHDMNKELAFLSAAAIFNQWINVSTFVGI